MLPYAPHSSLFSALFISFCPSDLSYQDHGNLQSRLFFSKYTQAFVFLAHLVCNVSFLATVETSQYFPKRCLPDIPHYTTFVSFLHPFPVRAMPKNQLASGPSMQAYDIPYIAQEDRDHAWELARKYPPDIVLFIIRDVLEQHSNSIQEMDRAMASPTLRSTPHTLELMNPCTQPINRPLTSIELNITTSQGEISGSSPSSSSGIGRHPVDSKDLGNGFTDTGTVRWSNMEISDGEDPSLGTPVPPDRGRGVIMSKKNSMRKSRRSSDKRSDSRSEQKKAYFCVFEEHKGIRFGKASDLRKHMNLYHEPSKKAWLCPEDGCHQFFSRAESLKQHHITHKDCRKPCKHADNGKIKIPPRQAFACGCQSCQALFFTWEEWREHIIQHIETGMSDSQWHYATIFLNQYSLTSFGAQR